jgi:NAD(P)-dependent dehydrogenase (short-subunit alcohol dehydrogenase family)
VSSLGPNRPNLARLACLTAIEAKRIPKLPQDAGDVRPLPPLLIGETTAAWQSRRGRTVSLPSARGSNGRAWLGDCKTFGRLDVLVNNAGTAIPKPFEEATLEELDRVIDINVRGVFVTTHAALRHMKRGGRIIMIGSSVGERNNMPGLTPYLATKGAVKMFTQGLAREVGSRGITVNNVQPGPIDTDLNPAAGDWEVPQVANTALGRYGKVDEVAALVAFVAGPESSYITGANLTVDGGVNA